MAVGDTSGENRISSEARSEKTSLEASEALDTVPLFLTREEREVLILFLNEVSNLSALYVERVIQTAYLFNIADLAGLAFDLNGSPYLTGFINAFKQYMSPKNEKELVEGIKKLEKYLLPEGKINAEMKRQKLITEVNKLVPKVYAVPSHRSFSITLQFLKEKGYIVAATNKSRTLWSINQDFYARWSARRHQLFDERTQKIKEFQNAGIAQSKAEINANEYMIDKYGIIVLDFYNVTYVPYQIDNIKTSDIKVVSDTWIVPSVKIVSKESLYLRYRVDIDVFLP